MTELEGSSPYRDLGTEKGLETGTKGKQKGKSPFEAGGKMTKKQAGKKESSQTSGAHYRGNGKGYATG